MRIVSLGIVLVMSSAITHPIGAAQKPYVSSRTLTLDMANQVAVKAAEHCRGQGYQVAVAVTDRAGQLLAFVRDPLAGPHTIEVAQAKAYTSATYRSASGAMMEREPALRFSPGVLLVGGGLPIEVAGEFYGGVGVSGAPARERTGDTDEVCARAGIDAVRETLEFAD